MKKIFQIILLTLFICCFNSNESISQTVSIGNVEGCPGDIVTLSVDATNFPINLSSMHMIIEFSNEWGTVDVQSINGISSLPGNDPNRWQLFNFHMNCQSDVNFNIATIDVLLGDFATGCITAEFIHLDFSTQPNCDLSIPVEAFTPLTVAGSICIGEDCPSSCCLPFSWDDITTEVVGDQFTICYPELSCKPSGGFTFPEYILQLVPYANGSVDNSFQYIYGNSISSNCITVTLENCVEEYRVNGGYYAECDFNNPGPELIQVPGSIFITGPQEGCDTDPCCGEAVIQVTHLSCGTVEVCVLNCTADEYTFTHPVTNNPITTGESCFTFYDLSDGLQSFSVTISPEGCDTKTVSSTCEVNNEGCDPCCEDAAIQYTHFDCGTVEVCIVNCTADAYIFTDPATNNQITTSEPCYTFTNLAPGLTSFSVIATSTDCGGVEVFGSCEVVNDCIDCCAPPSAGEVSYFSIGNNTLRICFPESLCDDPRYIIHWVEQCGENPPTGINISNFGNCDDLNYDPCCNYSFEVGYNNFEGCEGSNVQWSETFYFNPTEICDPRIPGGGGGNARSSEIDESIIGKELNSTNNSILGIDISNTTSIDPITLIAIPNPFKTEFQINLNVEKAEAYQLVFYDLDGKELLQLKGNLEKGENQILVNQLNGIPSGIYFYQLTTPSNQFSEKVIKY